MSDNTPITGELRSRAARKLASWKITREEYDEVEHLCDAIDAIHASLERENASLKAELDRVLGEQDRDGWVELPKDADGEHVHVGDVLTDDAEFKSEGKVMRLMLEDDGWMAGFGRGGWTKPSIHEWHHYHAPTVEDVLREMHAKLDEVIALYVGEAIDSSERDRDEARIFAEYAAKLRLAGE